MYRLITFLYLALVLTDAEVQNITQYSKSSAENRTFNIDAYIILNRKEHESNILDYENQMEIFSQNNAARLNIIKLDGDMLISSLTQSNERWYKLQVLSQLSSNCVKKHTASIPLIYSTETLINVCINAAKEQNNDLLSPALLTKRLLERYYNNIYEKNLESCKNKINNLMDYNYYFNYTKCVVDATNAAQEYTISNQHQFASQMDSAHSAADANIMKAFDCSYSIQNHTLSLIAEANTWINKCLLGEDDGKQCPVCHSCYRVFTQLKTDDIFTNKTILNPFYRRPDITDCYMFRLF